MDKATPITAEWALGHDPHALDTHPEEQPPEPVRLVPAAEEPPVPPELHEAREAMAGELEDLFARADELEARMRGIAHRSTVLAETARGHLTAPRHFPEPEAEPAPRPDTDPSAAQKPDLNALTAVELREAGLSRTQAARLLARREARGGFSSVRELDEVPGLPHELRAALKSRFTVRS